MTYLEALERASTFISNELASARSVLDKPVTFSIFIDKNGTTISIWNEEENCDVKT